MKHVPRTKFKGRYNKMKVNFDDKTRTFKSLEGETMRQVRFDTLVVLKASEIAKRRVLDVKQASLILEEAGVKFSSLFDDLGKPVTLKAICVDVLNPPETNDRGERKEGPEVRYKKAKLMGRIYEAKGEIDLTTEQVSQVKKLIAESTYSNVVLFQAFDWLEGEPEKE